MDSVTNIASHALLILLCWLILGVVGWALTLWLVGKKKLPSFWYFIKRGPLTIIEIMVLWPTLIRGRDE